MAKFKLPHDPSDFRNSFPTEDGKNPFSEQAEDVPQDENPYGSTLSKPADGAPYKPGDYEPFLPHRAGTVIRLGVGGLVLSTISIVGVVAGGLGLGSWVIGILYCMPIQLIGLAVSIPAVTMGTNDLKAMRAGAMDGSERSRTLKGMLLGLIGVLIGIIPVVALIAWVVFQAIGT